MKYIEKTLLSFLLFLLLNDSLIANKVILKNMTGQDISYIGIRRGATCSDRVYYLPKNAPERITDDRGPCRLHAIGIAWGNVSKKVFEDKYKSWRKRQEVFPNASPGKNFYFAEVNVGPSYDSTIYVTQKDMNKLHKENRVNEILNNPSGFSVFITQEEGALPWFDRLKNEITDLTFTSFNPIKRLAKDLTIDQIQELAALYATAGKSEIFEDVAEAVVEVTDDDAAEDKEQKKLIKMLEEQKEKEDEQLREMRKEKKEAQKQEEIDLTGLEDLFSEETTNESESDDLEKIIEKQIER